MVKKLEKRIRFLLSGQVFEKVAQNFITIFGIIWLFIESVSFFFSNWLITSQSSIFVFAIIFSVIGSLYISFPRLSYIRRYRRSNVKISVKVGDLLDNIETDSSHVVVGSNNHFTPYTNRSTGRSLRSQVVRRFYSKGWDLLDRDILKSLPRKKIINKANNSYKVLTGSVAAIEVNEKKIFFLINQNYDYESKELCNTTEEDIWLGLCNLWAVIKSRGGNSPVAVPVLGSKIGRAPASRISLIQLILISFAIANRTVPITEHLVIIISESDYSPDEMFEISRFMDDLDL